MATYGRLLAAYNDIVGDYGGQGNYVFDIDALNAWAIRLGGTGGHRIDVHAMNEIARLLGGSGGHIFAIDALNEISTRLGGTSGHRMQIDALNIMADLPVGGGATPEAETTALIARMTVSPDSTRKGHINTLVKSLKTAGVWPKLDALYVLAAHDAQAGLLNWKGSVFTLVPVNAPTFTLDRGYAGNGTSSYLDTGFNPATAGGSYTQDSASFFAWLTEAAQNANFAAGNVNTRLVPRNLTDGVNSRLNFAASTPATGTGSVLDARGLTAIDRPGATGWSIYKGAAALGSFTGASVAPSSQTFLIGKLGGASVFSNQQVAAHGFGASLGPSGVASLNAALLTYLQSVGAA